MMMTNQTILLPLLAFVTTTLFVLALMPPRGRTLRHRLAPYGPRVQPARERILAGSFVQRVLLPGGDRLLDLVAATAPATIRQQAALELARAGNPMGVEAYLALRVAAMVGLPLAYAAYLSQADQSIGLVSVAVLVLLFLAGRRASGWWVRGRIRERQRQVERSLPSALDLITVCMEAGLSFDAGLAKVVEKTHGPLADEFAQVLQEMQVGKQRRAALHDLARRNEVRDLTTFVAAIVQADQMGMSLAPVMRVQADEVRTRRRQLAEEQAMKASVKMLFPLIVCILPATVLVVLGPAIVTLFSQIFVQMGSWS